MQRKNIGRARVYTFDPIAAQPWFEISTFINVYKAN